MKDTKQLLEHLFEKHCGKRWGVPDCRDSYEQCDVYVIEAHTILGELMEACGMFEEEE